MRWNILLISAAFAPCAAFAADATPTFYADPDSGGCHQVGTFTTRAACGFN